MKKYLVALTVCLFSTVAFAQSYVGGGISGYYETESGDIHLSILPEFGYHLDEKSAVGFEMKYKFEKNNDRHIISLSPYYRRYLIRGRVGLFIDTTAGVTYTTNTEAWGIKIGFVPGLDYRLSEKFNLVSKFGFFGYYQPDETKKYIRWDIDGTDFSLGCVYNF